MWGQELYDASWIYQPIVQQTILWSHGLTYLLSIVGLLLRPFSQTLWDFSRREPSSLLASAVVFLYPWLHLWGKPPLCPCPPPRLHRTPAT